MTRLALLIAALTIVLALTANARALPDPPRWTPYWEDE